MSVINYELRGRLIRTGNLLKMHFAGYTLWKISVNISCFAGSSGIDQRMLLVQLPSISMKTNQPFKFQLL